MIEIAKMLRDLNIYNPKEFRFMDEDASDNGSPLWEALSDSSGHKSSAPFELWGEDAFYLLDKKIQNQHQKHLKKV